MRANPTAEKAAPALRGRRSGFIRFRPFFPRASCNRNEFFRKGPRRVARVNPGEFLRQVRSETAKIVWPGRRETLMTALMVVIMTALLGLFFFGIDSAFSAIVQALLGLLS
jgi:preprotein translocase subunit SecE